MRFDDPVDALGLEDEEPEPSYEVAAYVVYPVGYHDIPEATGREQWRLHVVDAGDGWAICRRLVKARCVLSRGTV